MPLGRHSPPVSGHCPEALYPIARADARRRLGIVDLALPFEGEDRWTGYELSWLDPSGKPQVGALHVRVPCTSPNMVESKSLKLYLNGLAQVRFSRRSELAELLATDLGAACGAEVSVRVSGLSELTLAPEALGSSHGGASPTLNDPSDRHRAAPSPASQAQPGRSLDELAPARFEYCYNPALLQPAPSREPVSETWHTDLFRSLCPVTGQPDWASMRVSYTGRPILAESLLAYLVSFREHACFHEDAIERIFMDIQQRCQPARLTVSGHFLRRGGLDINPYRSNENPKAPQRRLLRQ